MVSPALPTRAAPCATTVPALRMMAAAPDQHSIPARVANFVGSAAMAGSLLLPMTADAGFQLPPIDKNEKNRCEFKNSAMGQSNAAKDKLYDLRECDMSGQVETLRDLCVSVSLSLSLSHMYPHMHSLIHPLSHTRRTLRATTSQAPLCSRATLPRSTSRRLSHTHTRARAHTHIRSFSLTLTHTHSTHVYPQVTMSKVLAQKANFEGADFSNAVMDRGTYKGSNFKGAILANTVLM